MQIERNPFFAPPLISRGLISANWQGLLGPPATFPKHNLSKSGMSYHLFFQQEIIQVISILLLMVFLQQKTFCILK